MKKRIILYSSILAVLLFIILIVGNFFYNFNALAVDTIELPQNDKTDSEILKLGKAFKYTIDEYNKILTRELYLANPSGFMNCKIGELLHICSMRDLLQTCSIFNFEMRKANDDLVNHFITGNGGGSLLHQF